MNDTITMKDSISIIDAIASSDPVLIKEKSLDVLKSIIPWLLSHGIKIVLILIVSFLLIKVLRKIIQRTVQLTIVPGKHLSKTAETKRENTLINIFYGIARIVIITVASLMILTEFGLNIGPLLAGAGIIGLAVGFGGQYLIRDVIAGMFIILENQYRIGDVVSFDGTGGLVEEISLRMTTIRDLDGTVHHIPHGEIRKVSNLSKHFSRVNMNIGISYNSDLEHVIKVVNRTGKEMAEDPAWKESIVSPPQFLRVDEFADSAIIIKILGDTQPIKQWEVSGELRKRLKIAFDKEGIVIPFPQTVVHLPK
ncbi:MAG: mechanosensitive ion channel family protein [Bacteroidales bacterium]|nr:mechanosensitive ion channel family protein [Bacteroidales bacterium]MDD4640876.1 mechanosensitive ion channel family protein [Bacteroidales bacterium]